MEWSIFDRRGGVQECGLHGLEGMIYRSNEN